MWWYRVLCLAEVTLKEKVHNCLNEVVHLLWSYIDYQLVNWNWAASITYEVQREKRVC